MQPSVNPTAGRAPWIALCRRHCRPAAMLALAIALVALAYVFGLNVGMDRRFAGPLDTRAQQVSSALADTAYGLNMRYAVHVQIAAALTKGGLSDLPGNYQPHGLKAPAYVSNAEWWNDLLGKAAKLKDITGAPRVSDRTLSFVQPEDLGIIDYFKLSFRLFGYNVQGLYKTYFVLLTLGLAFLFAAFWSRPCVLFGANLLLYGLLLSICRLEDVESVANGRFFATLAILPTFHLMLLVWAPPRMTWPAAAAAAGQVLLLAFVISMRNSATWGVLLLGLSIAGMTVWKARRAWAKEKLGGFVKSVLTWPVVVVIAGLAVFGGYQNAKIHPGYLVLDETVPEHLVWHTLAYGLSFYPDIDALVPGLNGVRGDGLPTYLNNAYLSKIMGYEPPSISAYYVSHAFPSFGRWRTYERVARAAYFDFMREHPLGFLKFTLVTKPIIMVEALHSMSMRMIRVGGKYFLLASALIAAGLSLARPAAEDRRDVKLVALAIVGLALASCLAPIIAFPAYLAETFALWASAIAAAVAVVVLDPGWIRGLLRRRP